MTQALGRIVRLTLPYPLSANRYWRPVPIGNHVTIVPTKEAKAFKRHVADIARASMVLAPMQGRLAMQLALYPHRPLDWQKRMRQLGEWWDDSVQCIDLGNAEKVLSDALQGIVYDDDKQLRSITLDRWEPDAKGERCEVQVVQLLRTASQETLLQPEGAF